MFFTGLGRRSGRLGGSRATPACCAAASASSTAWWAWQRDLLRQRVPRRRALARRLAERRHPAGTRRVAWVARVEQPDIGGDLLATSVSDFARVYFVPHSVSISSSGKGGSGPPTAPPPAPSKRSPTPAATAPRHSLQVGHTAGSSTWPPTTARARPLRALDERPDARRHAPLLLRSPSTGRSSGSATWSSLGTARLLRRRGPRARRGAVDERRHARRDAPRGRPPSGAGLRGAGLPHAARRPLLLRRRRRRARPRAVGHRRHGGGHPHGARHPPGAALVRPASAPHPGRQPGLRRRRRRARPRALAQRRHLRGHVPPRRRARRVALVVAARLRGRRSVAALQRLPPGGRLRALPPAARHRPSTAP